MDSQVTVPVSLNIDGAAIDELVNRAIMESNVGAILVKVVRERLSGYRVESAVIDVVDDAIRKAAQQAVMRPEFADRIKALIAEKLTDDAVGRIVCKLFEQWK